MNVIFIQRFGSVKLESQIENATFESRDWKTNGKTPKAENQVSLGF